jgi:hypothetical protein
MSSLSWLSPTKLIGLVSNCSYHRKQWAQGCWSHLLWVEVRVNHKRPEGTYETHWIWLAWWPTRRRCSVILLYYCPGHPTFWFCRVKMMGRIVSEIAKWIENLWTAGVEKGVKHRLVHKSLQFCQSSLKRSGNTRSQWVCAVKSFNWSVSYFMSITVLQHRV